ncbi:MAG: hypothetical protein ACP5US_10910 [Candidatus Kryptoniota bacterium]
MFSFFELTKGTLIEPHLEFATGLKLDPTSLIDFNLFIEVQHKSGVDIYLPSGSSRRDQKPEIFRLTGQFRFRIKLDLARSVSAKKIVVYSASRDYFNHLTKLLTLEPSFRFKPPPDMNSLTIKSIILQYPFTSGYLEICSWGVEKDNPIFEELLITKDGQIDLIEITNINKIDTIAFYDIEKNKEIIERSTIDSKSPQLSLFNFEDLDKSTLSAELNKKSDAPEKNEEDILINTIAQYIRKNLSKSEAEVIITNTAGKSIPEILHFVDAFIKKIKFNQKEHREKIKSIVADFYTEHYKQISEQNFTQAIEEFYTNN